jgi:hypothetical protein
MMTSSTLTPTPIAPSVWSSRQQTVSSRSVSSIRTKRHRITASNSIVSIDNNTTNKKENENGDDDDIIDLHCRIGRNEGSLRTIMKLNKQTSLRSLLANIVAQVATYLPPSMGVPYIWRALEATCSECRHSLSTELPLPPSNVSLHATSDPPQYHDHDVRRASILPHIPSAGTTLSSLGFKSGYVPILVAARPQVETMVVLLEASKSMNDRHEALPLGLDRTCMRVAVTDTAATLRVALTRIFHMNTHEHDDHDNKTNINNNNPNHNNDDVITSDQMMFMYQEPLELNNYHAQRGWEPTTRASPWRILHEHQTLASLCRQPPHIHDDDIVGSGMIYPPSPPSSLYTGVPYDGYGRASYWLTYCPRLRVILPSPTHFNLAMAALMEISVYPMVRAATHAARMAVGDSDERTLRRSSISWLPAKWIVLQLPQPLSLQSLLSSSSSCSVLRRQNSNCGTNCSSGMSSNVVHHVLSYLSYNDRHQRAACICHAWRYHAWNPTIWTINDTFKWLTYQLDDDDRHLMKGSNAIPPPPPLSSLPVSSSPSSQSTGCHMGGTYPFHRIVSRIGVTSRPYHLYHHVASSPHTVPPIWLHQHDDNDAPVISGSSSSSSVRWPLYPWHYHPSRSDDCCSLPPPSPSPPLSISSSSNDMVWPSHFLSTQPPEPSVSSIMTANSISCPNGTIDLHVDPLSIALRHQSRN